MTSSVQRAAATGTSGNKTLRVERMQSHCRLSVKVATERAHKQRGQMSRSITSSDDRQLPVAFFDIDVDDAGLSVYEFRAYMRIVRRAAGGRSSCTESLENMANACQMSRPSMVRAIKTLVDRQMIRRESKLGETSTYVLTSKDRWIPGKSQNHVPGKPEIQGVDLTFTTGGKPQNHHLVNERSTKNTNKNTQKKTREESGVISPAASIARPHTPQVEDAVSIAVSIFSQMGIWQQDVIANGDINHLALWRKACEDWRDNRYSLRNITGLIDSYYRLEKQHNRDKEYQNGQNGHATRQTAGERKASEYLEFQRKLGQNASDDPDYKPLPGFEWLESIR